MAAQIVIPDATAAPDAYVQALLETLGDRDPIAVYGETPEEVSEQCQALRDDAWHVPLGSGEWSAYQLVGHLLDVDIVYGFRWRLILTAETPSYPGYDERAWAGLPKAAPDDLLAAFVALRSANLALVRSLTPQDRRRRGIHGEQGSEDVGLMIRKIAGHDLAHRDQLRRTVEHVTAGQHPGGIDR